MIQRSAYASAAVIVAAVATVGAIAGKFTGAPLLFFGHIAAMCCAWGLMTSGSVIYSVCTEWLGFEIGKSRMVHGIVQSAAVVFAAVGYFCIFRNHQLAGASQFGFDKGNPTGKVVHALLGYVVLAWMLLQASQGWRKYSALSSGKVGFLVKHGLNGRGLLLLAAANMVIVLSTFPFSQALFLPLAAGVLGTTVVAVLLTAPKPVASAREGGDAQPEVENQEPADLYEKLAAGDQ
ncbi:unnamed protein product [Polarella glacialis]|uniref:Cytochrome b561 domain-containing protein n=1 Tax=Polarella glacialis TaxID=89957 RepID=A0A813DZ97_POLGL|nr:unnamed protein product [Polarella glacialis]